MWTGYFVRVTLEDGRYAVWDGKYLSVKDKTPYIYKTFHNAAWKANSLVAESGWRGGVYFADKDSRFLRSKLQRAAVVKAKIKEID